MKKLLIICLFLLFPFSSYGKSIVDKGLVCVGFENKFLNIIPLVGFWFDKDNTVSLFQLKNEGWFDDIKGKYKVNDFSISIDIEEPNLYMGKFSINRNNGKLTHKKYDFNCKKIHSLKEGVIMELEKRHSQIVKRRINEKKKKEKEYKDKLNKRKF